MALYSICPDDAAHPSDPGDEFFAERALEILFQTTEEGEDGAIFFLGAVDPITGERDLALRPLDGYHPGPLLQSLEPDPRWRAIGVVARGKATSVDPPYEQSSTVVGHVLTASGASFARLRLPDGSLSTEPATVGEMVDALRRVVVRR